MAGQSFNTALPLHSPTTPPPWPNNGLSVSPRMSSDLILLTKYYPPMFQRSTEKLSTRSWLPLLLGRCNVLSKLFPGEGSFNTDTICSSFHTCAYNLVSKRIPSLQRDIQKWLYYINTKTPMRVHFRVDSLCLLSVGVFKVCQLL